MTKTILITGATDGIGLLTAKTLAAQGHKLLVHGRSEAKLDAALAEVGHGVQGYLADLSDLAAVDTFATQVKADHAQLDVLINNAGVLKAPNPRMADGQDLRWVVNTLAPIRLAEALLPIIPADGRVLNLSSAAQAPVDVAALQGGHPLGDMEAYAQSELALTIWSAERAKTLPDGPVIIAVNPGSLLASKMVKEGFGVAGNDLSIGSGILCELALGSEYANASGRYWDNDSGRFASPHGAAHDPRQVEAVMGAVASLDQ